MGAMQQLINHRASYPLGTMSKLNVGLQGDCSSVWHRSTVLLWQSMPLGLFILTHYWEACQSRSALQLPGHCHLLFSIRSALSPNEGDSRFLVTHWYKVIQDLKQCSLVVKKGEIECKVMNITLFCECWITTRVTCHSEPKPNTAKRSQREYVITDGFI